MKRVVFLEDIAESEIRPDSLYRKYQDILQEELPKFFPDQSSFVKTNCPGCGSADFEEAFVKVGFQYCKCSRCSSVFVSPRPTAAMLDNFYRNSEAPRFWWTEMAQKTKESRHRHQSFPMAHWVLESVDEYIPDAKCLLDYHSKYPDLLHIIGEAKKFDQIVSVSPKFPDQEGFFHDETTTYESINQVEGEIQVFTAFEILDRIFDPLEFINEINKACQSGGLLFLTGNTISGFEYQMLNGMSPRLHPPDRLNLLSIEAIQNRLTESGFEVIELSTPGRVDVQIVRDVLKKNPDLETHDIFKYIFENRDEKTWHSLQDFLQQNRLSSYVRVMARKK